MLMLSHLSAGFRQDDPCKSARLIRIRQAGKVHPWEMAWLVLVDHAAAAAGQARIRRRRSQNSESPLASERAGRQASPETWPDEEGLKKWILRDG